MDKQRFSFIVAVVCLFVCALFIFASCGSRTQEAKKEVQVKRFTPPSIPTMLIDPQERVNYLVVHYWDSFDFSDTTLLDPPAYTEQAFAPYVEILSYAPFASIVSSIRQTMEKTLNNKQMCLRFAELFEKYFYDPNAPTQDEELYAPVVESVIHAAQIDEVEKIRFRFQWEQIQKNRKGSTATDFIYMLPNGMQGNMRQLKAEHLLLFFYDPECHTCEEIRQSIHGSPIVTEAINRNLLKVLAVYTGKDITIWEAYQTNIPKTWMNTCDALQIIDQNGLYDLRALPIMYLLDKNKAVLFKDASLRQLEQWFSTIGQ